MTSQAQLTCMLHNTVTFTSDTQQEVGGRLVFNSLPAQIGYIVSCLPGILTLRNYSRQMAEPGIERRSLHCPSAVTIWVQTRTPTTTDSGPNRQVNLCVDCDD